MALVDVSAEKTLKWNYSDCVLRTFRVEGRCKPVDSSSGVPCGPCGDGTQQGFVVNVVGCNVEDVCRKLRERKFVRTINCIQVYNAPLFDTIPPTPNPYTLIDQTPTIDNCQECCPFLIDEDLDEVAKVVSLAMGAFHYKMSGSIVISQQPSPRFWYNGGGAMQLSSDFIVAPSNYLYGGSGTIITGGSAGVACSHYIAAANGGIVLSGSFPASAHLFNHQASGTITVSGNFRLHFHYQASGTITISGGQTSNLRLYHGGSGTIVVGSEFNVISSAYSYTVNGTINIVGNVIATGSNLGTVDVFAAVDEVADDIGVTFTDEPAIQFPVQNSLISQPNCCNTAIADSCTLIHNLDSVLGLQRFLLRNGLLLPGSKTGPVLSLQYNPRFDIWQANTHLSGLSVLDGSPEAWSFSFEMFCSDNAVWTVSMNVKRANSSGDSVIRLICLFDGSVFCPTGQPFSKFEFLFNVKTFELSPAGRIPIFHDESSVFISSPSFIKNPNLRFKISAGAGDGPQMRDVLLEIPYHNSVHVADASGHPVQ